MKKNSGIGCVNSEIVMNRRRRKGANSWATMMDNVPSKCLGSFLESAKRSFSKVLSDSIYCGGNKCQN